MKTAKVLSPIAFILLAVALLVSVIDYCSFNRSFYEKEYITYNNAAEIGMSTDDLMNATNVLLDYLKDERDDIVVEANVNGNEREVFNDRETAHMVDVKALYQKAIMTRNLMAIAGIALLALALFLGRDYRTAVLKNGYQIGVAMVLILLSFLAISAIADFDRFWTQFHMLFFDNDLWLLDPNTSIMINMFPSGFFFDLVIRIIVIYAVLLVIGGVLISFYAKKRSHL